MATYVFENMTADQAASFTSGDTLAFSTTALQPVDVIAASSGSNLALTAGSRTLSFPATAFGTNNIQFASSSSAGRTNSLFLGSDLADTVTVQSGHDGNVAFGFNGNDTLNSNFGADVLFGGGGNDNIDGGGGADHVYGYGLTGDPTTDGDDTIRGGAGGDYVQGNAGADMLFGDDGSDRLVGGAGADSIKGGDGNDSVNGNKGNDIVNGDAGNDLLRGGQDDDLLFGSTGNDILMGDLGNDTLNGGPGLDVLTGGAGADIFAFNGGDAVFNTAGEFAYFGDSILDFTDGTDLIQLASNVGNAESNILHAEAGVQLNSLADALSYAQQILNAHGATSGGGDVAVLQVGSDAYLFYNGAGVDGAAVDSLIKVAGIGASTITSADIITSITYPQII